MDLAWREAGNGDAELLARWESVEGPSVECELTPKSGMSPFQGIQDRRCKDCRIPYQN